MNTILDGAEGAASIRRGIPMISSLETRTYLNSRTGLRYYNLHIDGAPLESIVAEQNPNYFRPGLVPTLLNWLRDATERETVWNRVLPPVGANVRCPIMMCNDECNFSCDLMIVDVERSTSMVMWKRVSLGQTLSDDAEYAFDDIPWIPNWTPVQFKTLEYENVLERFRVYLNDYSRNAYPLLPGEKTPVLSSLIAP